MLARIFSLFCPLLDTPSKFVRADTGDSQVGLTELADIFHVGQETTSVVVITFEVWRLTEMGENYTSSKVGWRVGLVLGKKKGSNSHVTFEMLLGIQMKH